ncbi:hypothetical protein [Herbidospora sp. NBRC 101105]|uniref:hypothetical protein n=1 Tax=Herbidospora sp. NBRC 101105 TaxID=3032195 RepID=UPI0024A235C2|nr:hypothetical protein [Herbidospora sp. NBRC 101105]GLX97810.1 hypothetical protein Hesp01_57600 [Herbidospora sp. NBRC 101105]
MRRLLGFLVYGLMVAATLYTLALKVTTWRSLWPELPVHWIAGVMLVLLLASRAHVAWVLLRARWPRDVRQRCFRVAVWLGFANFVELDDLLPLPRAVELTVEVVLELAVPVMLPVLLTSAPLVARVFLGLVGVVVYPAETPISWFWVALVLLAQTMDGRWRRSVLWLGWAYSAVLVIGGVFAHSWFIVAIPLEVLLVTQMWWLVRTSVEADRQSGDRPLGVRQPVRPERPPQSGEPSGPGVRPA